jgi:hypothetical protein
VYESKALIRKDSWLGRAEMFSEKCSGWENLAQRKNGDMGSLKSPEWHPLSWK